MELAKSLDAADVYIELSRDDPSGQFAQLKEDNPYGFDIGQSNERGPNPGGQTTRQMLYPLESFQLPSSPTVPSQALA